MSIVVSSPTIFKLVPAPAPSPEQVTVVQGKGQATAAQSQQVAVSVQVRVGVFVTSHRLPTGVHAGALDHATVTNDVNNVENTIIFWFLVSGFWFGGYLLQVLSPMMKAKTRVF